MTNGVITFVFVTLLIFSTVLCYPVEEFDNEFLPNIRRVRSPLPYCPDCENPLPPNNPPPIPNNPSPPPNNLPSPPNHPSASINPSTPPNRAPNNLSSPCASASAQTLPSNGGSPRPCATGASAPPEASQGSGGDRENADAHLVPSQFQKQQYGGADLKLSATLAANFDSSFRDVGLHSTTNNPVAPISRKVCLFCKIYDSS